MSTIRIWDKDFKLLATQDDCPPPPMVATEITIDDDGAVPQYIQQWVNTHPRPDLYVTIDAKTHAEFLRGVFRSGGMVTRIVRHGDAFAIKWAC